MSAVFDQVMAQCSRGCFTGLLRVRTREGNGEIRFLSGIQDGIRFDSMEGDAALERLQSASEPEFEAISSLPPIHLDSTEPVPPEGGLDRFHAAQLMRYCESNSLTCALELETGGKVLTARYRLGELLSVEPDSEHTAKLAEAKQGTYRFRLPRFELPASVQQTRPAPVVAPKVAAIPVIAVAPRAPSTAAVSTVAAKPAAASPSSSSRPVAPGAPVSPRVAPRVASLPVATPALRAVPTPSYSSEGTPPSRTAAVAASTPAGVGNARPPARDLQPVAGFSMDPTPLGGARAVQAIPPGAPKLNRPSPLPLPPAAGQGAPPLQGLWSEAVSPPPQSAPLELESAPSGAPGSRRPASAVESAKPAAANPGLASAWQPTPSAASHAVEAEVPLKTRSAAPRVWLTIALLLAIAIAVWLAFGRPLP